MGIFTWNRFSKLQEIFQWIQFWRSSSNICLGKYRSWFIDIADVKHSRAVPWQVVIKAFSGEGYCHAFPGCCTQLWGYWKTLRAGSFFVYYRSLRRSLLLFGTDSLHAVMLTAKQVQVGLEKQFKLVNNCSIIASV